jgi:dolichol-phosphate mannosyltransferase
VHDVGLSDMAAVLSTVDRIRPDWVFHLAAHGAYSWQVDVETMIRTNVLATACLVQVCRQVGVEAFINAGSSSEYGFKDHAPSETECLAPNSHYAVTKAFGTQLCAFEARSGAPFLTLRLYSVFGPYEDPRRLMPTVIALGLEGRLPRLVDPEVARDYVYLDDVIEAFVLAARRCPGEHGAVYNVGTGVQTSIRDVVTVARGVFAIEDEPRWSSMPNRVWDSSTWLADSRSIRTDLGWRPRFSFSDGFRTMVEAVRERPDLLARYRESAGSRASAGGGSTVRDSSS